MIGSEESSAIKHLLSSPQWQVIELLADEMCAKIASEQRVFDTEWETLSATLLAEGQVRGVRRFIQSLYEIISKS